jgi:transcription-repair coupling factor (superfamily II helicase)
MQLTGLLNSFRDSDSYQQLLQHLQAASTSEWSVIRSARPFVLAALAQDWKAPIIYVTAQVKRAYNVSEQLPAWLGDRPVLRFAEPTPMFYERIQWGDSVIRNRLETLAALVPPDESTLTQNPPIIVTSARALMQRTLPVTHFFRKGTAMRLEKGQRHAIDKLLQGLLGLGYEANPIVVEPGTFSRRGGIIDIFPLAAQYPVRIEFFDDEIDTLRQFDPSTQRSIGQISEAFITPAREVLPSSEAMQPLVAHLADWFHGEVASDIDVASLAADEEGLSRGAAFDYLEFYLPYIYPTPVSLLDYAPQGTLIVIEDWNELRDIVNEITETAEHTRAERLVARALPADYPVPYIAWETLKEAFDSHTTLQLDLGEELERVFVPGGRFGGQLKMLLNTLRSLRDKGDTVITVTQQAQRLADLWYEQEGFMPTLSEVVDRPGHGALMFVPGMLQEGWTLRDKDSSVHLLTDAEIFGWSRPEPRRRKSTRRTRLPEADYADLKSGDYVVHVDYGIGRFIGTRRRTVESVEREYLAVEYGGTDMVFVPIHQADRLTRYVGPDDKPPTLNQLGQADWTRVKSRAKQAVEEEARELLDLYATRAEAEGHAFSPDTHEQHEMEAAFPYVETEDQLRAARDVKADMENAHPMDRLVCGDVGFGKTEVALRAAFKSVMDGKQVALLVPTTVLAQQHYETFSSRLAPFPVIVEVMSRFRTKEEQRAVLPRLASGEVDIIIGTHRLLSDDIQLKNLGLVIIDEEQRFGVKHKEHFKRFRTQVDVLTLTATPIPRTLYMSLTGVRDISMIQTPPEERLPVITHAGPFDEKLVRQAVLRELERGGQVFVVHNRVQTIDAIRERFERIVPEARIGVGHGQMNERQLESVMAQFGRGEYDILISTSIIESGLDIPNANTLIVDRADWFGMAQLYQLRGRVGRSAQQAYAYFFHAGSGKLTEEARARLETLSEHTDLGAGYQIAMRDLELRGAGDILSTRQTGHVAAIGLHLYTQLLSRAVHRLKDSAYSEAAEETKPIPDEISSVVIDLPLPAYLPTDWIPEMALRLQIYRRIAGLTQVEDVDLMREELKDRFGTLPGAVEGLLYQIEVKLRAQAASATAILGRGGIVSIKLPYLPEINRERLQRHLGDGVQVTRTAVQIPLTDDTWQLHLLDVLAKLSQGIRIGTGV